MRTRIAARSGGDQIAHRSLDCLTEDILSRIVRTMGTQRTKRNAVRSLGALLFALCTCALRSGAGRGLARDDDRDLGSGKERQVVDRGQVVIPFRQECEPRRTAPHRNLRTT